MNRLKTNTLNAFFASYMFKTNKGENPMPQIILLLSNKLGNNWMKSEKNIDGDFTGCIEAIKANRRHASNQKF